MFSSKQFKLKHLVFGLLILNSTNSVFADQQTKEHNNSNDLFIHSNLKNSDLIPQNNMPLKQSYIENFSNNLDIISRNKEISDKYNDNKIIIENSSEGANSLNSHNNLSINNKLSINNSENSNTELSNKNSNSKITDKSSIEEISNDLDCKYSNNKLNNLSSNKSNNEKDSNNKLSINDNNKNTNNKSGIKSSENSNKKLNNKDSDNNLSNKDNSKEINNKDSHNNLSNKDNSSKSSWNNSNDKINNEDNIKKVNENNINNIEYNDFDENIFGNWSYNDEDKCNNSVIKKKYKKLASALQKDNLQLQSNLQPLMTLNIQNPRKLSDISRNSVKSHFSNPLVISRNNRFKRIDEFLNKYEEIIPIITLQSDGLQVLDTIAHLSAFNSFYKLTNFGASPYIYCASSASIPALSLALDLKNHKDPVNTLELIGKKLYENYQSKSDNESNHGQKKCCTSWLNKIKLLWFKLFGCCIDYEDENIIDSLYPRIQDDTVENIMENILNLNKNSEINLPNLVIKNVNSEAYVIDQVLQANSNQNSKSTKNQVTLFSKPLVSVFKHFVDSDKVIIQKGIDIAENNTKSNGLEKIRSQDEFQFIQQNNLHDSSTGRLVIMLRSNVDGSNTAQSDNNNLKILLEENKECNLWIMKIDLFTINSLTSPNFSLKDKFNNFYKVMDNSEEFKYITENLPQYSAHDGSSTINLSNSSIPHQNISIENSL